ncbi:MAG: 1-acyl-sn-glycerol-3-phosphate acyltransferase [Archangium sp.]|nr:1-acyl-sn-glycerol-3-phosphate acyltransferase [Archangium sp.]
MARTFAIQRLYTALHLRAVTLVFSLKFVIHGSELVRPGPVLVFCRHASLVDVLIPGGFIANVHKLELRYVLKRELLAEPCLDVAGHWIPNHFVDRRGLDTEKELAAVGALKAGIGQNEGVIIYPEGTRFSAARREAGLVKLEGAGLARAERLRHLLPIRPGGALTLLAAAPSCDVLFVGHHGLEGLTRLEDIWRGSLVGRTVTVQFWREPADSIPPENAARLLWVNDRWQRMDDWLETLS